MTAAWIIEPIYVFEDFYLRLAPRLPRMSPDKFSFDGFEERLDSGIEAPIFVNTAFSMFLACKDV